MIRLGVLQRVVAVAIARTVRQNGDVIRSKKGTGRFPGHDAQTLVVIVIEG